MRMPVDGRGGVRNASVMCLRQKEHSGEVGDLSDRVEDAKIGQVVDHREMMMEAEIGYLGRGSRRMTRTEVQSGSKQSGIGREYGRFGLATHLEARAVLA
jgi:hypothetical protein